MPELSVEEKCELALDLCRKHRLTERQYLVYCLREEGRSVREVLDAKVTKGKRRTLFYDLAHAREVMEEAIATVLEGRPRDGVTVQQGHEAFWKPDKTAQRRCPDSESNWPDPAVLATIYDRRY